MNVLQLTVKGLRNNLYVLLEFSFLLLIAIYLVNKISNNTLDLGVLIVVYSVVGFILLTFNSKHSYVGSLMLSSSLITLVLLSTYGIIFKLEYIVYRDIILIFAISYILIFIGHHLSYDKNWPILSKMYTNKFMYSFISYILTLSFMTIFYLGNDLPNKMTFIIIIFILVYSYSISNINYCQRETLIQSYIDISNKQYSIKLLSYLKNRRLLSENQNEIIVSEFINSIKHFIEGNYKNSILSSYIAIEAFERISQRPNNVNLRNSKFSSRRQLIANWRNFIAHSNVEAGFVRQDIYTISYYLRAFHSILHTYDILYVNQISTFTLDV